MYHNFKPLDIDAEIARLQMDTQAVMDWAYANDLELNE